MTSGLEFNEGYENDPISDVNFMLMSASDLPAFAAKFPVTAEPGTRWAYQTASPVLLGRIMRDSFSSEEDYYYFPQRELFDKLGMRNAHYQMDAGGTYVGGAFLYATARDWARFGLMYLNDGVVDGVRILPEGWVQLSSTPTDASLKARAYAAQFWLNQESAERMMPSIPVDAYAARGHYGQSTFIVPSRDLVVVRMGQSFSAEAWDMEQFLADVLAALPE
jgi:CubicO group peptidase (beta-lactamase class C family)